MDKQTVLGTLQEALNDGNAIEQKLRQLIRERRIDADTLATALTRIERFQFDMQIVIEDIQGGH